MKFKRKRPLTKPEATAGLSAVRSAQGDMRQLQKMLTEIGPHLQTIAAMSGRIDRLEAEVAELKRRQ